MTVVEVNAVSHSRGQKSLYAVDTLWYLHDLHDMYHMYVEHEKIIFPPTGSSPFGITSDFRPPLHKIQQISPDSGCLSRCMCQPVGIQTTDEAQELRSK